MYQNNPFSIHQEDPSTIYLYNFSATKTPNSQSLLKTEYKTICDRFLEAEIIRKQFIYALSNFLFKSLVKCLFCKICFADILNPKYRAGNVLYSKQTYVYPFPEDTGPIKFRLSRDLFAGLKMGYFWPLI